MLRLGFWRRKSSGRNRSEGWKGEAEEGAKRVLGRRCCVVLGGNKKKPKNLNKPKGWSTTSQKKTR